MKHLTLLLIAALTIGNFVTPAKACMPPPTWNADAAEVVRTHVTPGMHYSRRMLRNQVRGTWKTTRSSTIGF